MGKGKRVLRGHAGLDQTGLETSKELLLYLRDGGESLRILEQDNYRLHAQKVWEVRCWKQGDQPETQVLGG